MDGRRETISCGWALRRTLFCCVFCLSLTVAAQESSPVLNANNSADQNSPEITTQDVTTTFKVSVDLVTVRVAVRDANGHAVGHLTREDFQVFDEGKPQTISRFSLEKTGDARPAAAEDKLPPAPPTDNGAALPERYIAYVLDDVHSEFSDLARVKQATERAFATLGKADRAAIYTTSGRDNLDFTDDRARLAEALSKIQPHPLGGAFGDCPHVSYYMADLIVNHNDRGALAAASRDLQRCLGYDPTDPRTAHSLGGLDLNVVTTAAMAELQVGNTETRAALDTLGGAAKRMALLPGERIIVFLSPGFYVADRHLDAVGVMDRAIRANVVINALDPQGLHVSSLFKAENGGLIKAGDMALLNYEFAEERANNDILDSLAGATGGKLIHNTNDLDGGLRRMTELPEYFYTLAFSPQGVKRDGKFHKLKVKVSEPELTVSARSGYYAPNDTADPERIIHQNIEDALFSRQTIHEIPLEIHSKFFRMEDGKARLSVTPQVDISSLPFRKDAGRNCDKLTIVSGVFDRNGILLEGHEKVVELRLRDETLERLRSGINVKFNYELSPGSYFVRVVLRDTEGKQLSAKSSVVEIP